MHLPPLLRIRLACGLAAVLMVSAAGTAQDSAEQTGGNEPVIGISYVGLSTSDLDARLEFYRNAGDLELVASGEGSVEEIFGIPDNAPQDVGWRLLRGHNAQVLLHEFANRSAAGRAAGAVPVNGRGPAHLCYRVIDTVRTYQRFLESGAVHVGEKEMASLNERNPILYAYAKDPDGVLFEIEHITTAKVPEAARAAFPERAIRHISLATPDMSRAVAFYSSLLGQPKPRRAGEPDGFGGPQFDAVSGLPSTRIKMAWFQVGNLELELIQYLSHPPEDPADPRPLDAVGYNMVVFEVNDIDAVKQRVLDAGGALVSKQRATEQGKVLFARDLDQNLIGFLQTEPDSPYSTTRFRQK